MTRSWIVALSWLCACGRTAKDVEQVTADFPPGLSDLTITADGHLWAIAERDPVIAEITLAGSPLAAHVVRHPVTGIPDGVDTEALADLGHGRFALGTEGHDIPAANVMFGQLASDGSIAFVPAFSVTGEQLGIPLQPNQGVESMCAVGEDLLVGIEVTGVTATGARYAPLVRVAGATQVVQKLLLTSPRGKLSALTCAPGPNGSVELFAIERDYGITRILHATAPRDATEIHPTVVRDLWPVIRDKFAAKLNLEGIARLADGRLVLVNDNQGRGLGGPTWLFVSAAR